MDFCCLTHGVTDAAFGTIRIFGVVACTYDTNLSTLSLESKMNTSPKVTRIQVVPSCAL